MGKLIKQTIQCLLKEILGLIQMFNVVLTFKRCKYSKMMCESGCLLKGQSASSPSTSGTSAVATVDDRVKARDASPGV